MPGFQLTALPGSTQPATTLTAPIATLPPLSQPTPTRSGQKVGDAAQWAYNVPADGSSFATAEEISLEIGILNVGSTTWTTDYSLAYVGGYQLSGLTRFYLTKEVKPGEKAVFNIWGRMPYQPGSYTTYFNLYFAYTVN